MFETKSRWMAVAYVALLACAGNAVAGPPLICHPLDAGNAALLPWGQGPSWNTIDRSYEVRNLLTDVVRLLTPEAPLLARMENLRRATVYASQQPAIATVLLEALLTRAAAGPQNRLAWFDAAYLIETYRQAKTAQIGDLLRDIDAPRTSYRELNELDGERMLETLFEREGASAELEFARARMAHESRAAREHWRQASVLAQTGSPLARNLEKYAY